MKLTKKLTSLLLSVLLISSCFIVGTVVSNAVSFAIDSVTNRLVVETTLNKDYPSQTEITDKIVAVTVTYYLTAPELIVDGQGFVTYDNTKLRLVSMELPKITDMLWKNESVSANKAKFSFSKLGAFDFTKGGEFVVLTFEVIGDAKGTASVDLTVEELDAADEIYFKAGEAKDVSVLSSLITPTVTNGNASSQPTSPDTTKSTTDNSTPTVSDAPTQTESETASQQSSSSKPAETTVPTSTSKSTDPTESETTSQQPTSAKPTESVTPTDSRNPSTNPTESSTMTVTDPPESDEPSSQAPTESETPSSQLPSSFEPDGTSAPTESQVPSTDPPEGESTQPTSSETPSESLTPTESDTPSTDPTESETPDAPTETESQEPTTTPSTPTQPSTPAPTQPTTAKPNATQPTTVKPATSFGKGTDGKSVEQALTNTKSDSDPKGSTFNLLQVKNTSTTKNSIKLSYKKPTGAKTFVIYGAKCGSKYKVLKTVKAKSVNIKKLKKGKYYKFLVVALNSKGKVVATSKTIHVATKGGTYGNPNKVKITNATAAKTLKKGKTITLKTKTTAAKGVQFKTHRKVRFESSNTKILKVNATSGKVTAKKAGKATIYAYAQNGVMAKVTIKVK